MKEVGDDVARLIETAPELSEDEAGMIKGVDVNSVAEGAEKAEAEVIIDELI